MSFHVNRAVVQKTGFDKPLHQVDMAGVPQGLFFHVRNMPHRKQDRPESVGVKGFQRTYFIEVDQFRVT